MDDAARAHPAFADGLFEAERGLWLSAAESFGRAADAHPDDPAPALAAAVCHLRAGQPHAAVVRLETSAGLRAPSAPWRSRLAWLRVAARLEAGDPLGAEQAVEALSPRLTARALATARLASEDYRGAVRALLAPHVPARLLSPER